jgi:AcrR family transcriptional regulator
MSKPLSPRKNPRQARAVATREAIIEAAARIVAESGLAGFNTNAVAERAGVSIGSLYQYFPNKDALMVALIARQQARQIDAVVTAAGALSGSTAGLDDTVRLLVQAAMQHHREDALLASAIDHEEARLPVDAIVRRELDRGGATLSAVIRQMLPAMAEEQIVRAARTLPALVRATVDAWANLFPPELQTAEDEAVRAVLGYLRAAPLTSSPCTA